MNDRLPDDALSADPQGLAETVAKAMLRHDANAQHLGIQLEKVAPGFSRMTMKLRPEMLNSHKIGHGGLIFTLADTAFAYACNSRNLATVASGCSIDFVAPAHLGDTLTATAEERSLAGRTGVYDITVTNQHQQVVAHFRGKSYRIKGAAIPEQDRA